MAPTRRKLSRNETKPAAVDESSKSRKKKNSFDPRMVTRSLMTTFVKKLKESLFMHQSRLMEIYNVVNQVDAENSRIQGVLQLLDIFRQPPAVPAFLRDMLFLFLKPEEALELNCYESYRSRTQALEISLKLHQHPKLKSKSVSKGFLKSLCSDESVASDPNAFYKSISSFISGDAHFHASVVSLFPDQPFDASRVCTADMETVTNDLLTHEPTEFEVMNWTDSHTNEISSFRHCKCGCHQESTVTGATTAHCGLCMVKFSGGNVYIWRGNRLVRAQVSLSKCKRRPSPGKESISTLPSKAAEVSADVGMESNRLIEPVDQDADQTGVTSFNAVSTTPKKTSANDDFLVSYGVDCKSSSIWAAPSTTPKKQWANDDSNQDVLKRGFMETFGRNLWGKGFSPFKRPNVNFGMCGLSEESNSTSNVFVRGFDGANTMLATLATESNSCATSTMAIRGAAAVPNLVLHGESSVKMPVERTPVTAAVDVPSSSSALVESVKEEEERFWTEDDDRYLLDQYKYHGNVYEAATAAMSKLKKSRHTVRDRLKLLLDLLKEGM